MTADSQWTCTRDQLVDAIACIELRVPQSGPMAGKVPAEQMADAILSQLPEWRDVADAEGVKP